MIRDFLNRLHFPEYKKYRRQVWKTNRKSMGIFLFLCMIVVLLNILVNVLFVKSLAFRSNFYLLAYFVIASLIYIFAIRKHIEYSTLKFYLLQFPVLMMTILMGTVMDKETPMFTFAIMIMVLPVFILDKPWRVCASILLYSLIFILLDKSAKSPELFKVDMAHLATCIFMSLSLNCFVLSDRINNVMKIRSSQDSAEHDQMTGLYNREGETKIRNMIANGIAGTFILMDIDDFKHINDNYGHSTGDEVLKKFSIALSQSFRQNDIVMRMGGDEFIVYAPGMQDYNFVEHKLHTICGDVNRIALDQESKDLLSVSIGCVINDGSFPDYSSVFEEADKLLYQVKQTGKNSFRLQNISYDPVRAPKRGQTYINYDDSPEQEAQN